MFTKLTSKDHIDLTGYLKSRSLGHYLERYDIDLSSALVALKDLQLMNINYLTLFPDLQGAALEANMQKFWIDTHDVATEVNAVAKAARADRKNSSTALSVIRP